MEKGWYLVGRSQIKFRYHLRWLADTDILMLLLPYLEGTYVRNLIKQGVIDVACDIDFDSNTFSVITCPASPDFFLDLHVGVSRPNDRDRQRFLDNVANDIALTFFFLEEDLKHQTELASL